MESHNNSETIKQLHELIHNKPEVLNKKYDDIDSDSDSDDDYISTTKVENQKLEDTIRFLKLDLNNEQLKVIELEEKIIKLTELNKKHENNLTYVKECLRFMNNDNNFISNIGLHNISEYNKEIIDFARKFFKIEREYNAIKQYSNIDSSLKETYDILITNRFNATKLLYENSNNSLKSIDNTFRFMKILIFILVAVNMMSFFFK